MNDYGSLATITAAGATGSGATYWLNQVNPWLAFVSGLLTITFMSVGLWKMYKDREG